MKAKRKWTTVRVDSETAEILRQLADASERSVPRTIRVLVLRARREQEAGTSIVPAKRKLARQPDLAPDPLQEAANG